MTKIQDIRGRTPRSNDTRNLSQIDYIVRHHSATEDGDFDTFWKHWNGTKGWGTGGYHEIILRDGTVQLCYDPNEITNGVGDFNTPCYHICMVGNGSFTKAQEKAWDERVAYNMQRLNVGVDHVKGHNEMPGANTSCPGIDMDTIRSRIKGVQPSKPAAPKQDDLFTKDAKWPKYGNVGPNVGKWQRKLKELGFYKGKIDNSFGPATDRATKSFQEGYDLVPDGQAGPASNAKADQLIQKKRSKHTVHLPASAKMWRTYKLNVQPVKKNSDWSLTPSVFGGLTYDVLGTPYTDVVTIKTSRGKRNIYVGPGTGAKIK